MPECRFPFQKYPVVTLAHGAGGRFTQQLIDDVFSAAMPDIQAAHDGAVTGLSSGGVAPVVISTDSYVVTPLFFPGGDIGKLAVTGTCNDLAMCGARPEALTCGWIIEEGFATEALFELALSMGRTAREVGAKLLAGDTKVVERGHGDGVYINVSGVGRQILHSHPNRICVGDDIIVSGDIGRHGCAILTQREDLQLQPPISSDCAHLWPDVTRLSEVAEQLHCLRDLTRGGLATALAELSRASACQFTVERDSIPVSEDVASVCELFGLDPLYVANEGRMVVIAERPARERILALLGEQARVIGQVRSGQGVVAHSTFGSSQILDLLSGEQLPRIC